MCTVSADDSLYTSANGSDPGKDKDFYKSDKKRVAKYSNYFATLRAYKGFILWAIQAFAKVNRIRAYAFAYSHHRFYCAAFLRYS